MMRVERSGLVFAEFVRAGMVFCSADPCQDLQTFIYLIEMHPCVSEHGKVA